MELDEVILFIVESVLAGLSIGLGGCVYSLVNALFRCYLNKSNNEYVNEVGVVLSSSLFSIGLLLVCRFSLLLYTGKVGLMFERKQSMKYYIGLLFMMLINVVSSYGLGVGVYHLMNHFKVSSFCNVFVSFSNELCKSKLGLNHLKVLVQSFFCGSCVYLSVKSFNVVVFRFKGVILLWWFVFMFVYNGLQHCIANSYYFGQANMLNKDVVVNVVICVIGNCLGVSPVVMLFNKLNICDNSSDGYSSDSDYSTSSLSTSSKSV